MNCERSMHRIERKKGHRTERNIERPQQWRHILTSYVCSVETFDQLCQCVQSVRRQRHSQNHIHITQSRPHWFSSVLDIKLVNTIALWPVSRQAVLSSATLSTSRNSAHTHKIMPLHWTSTAKVCMLDEVDRLLIACGCNCEGILRSTENWWWVWHILYNWYLMGKNTRHTRSSEKGKGLRGNRLPATVPGCGD